MALTAERRENSLDNHGDDMTDAEHQGTERTETRAAPCANISEPWFCVYTKPLLERQTMHRIREEGGTAWLPLEAPPKHRKVERERITRPLFPRYCFVQVYPWRVVRNAGGEEMGRVLVSVTTGRPLALPNGAVEFLMSQCAANGVMNLPEPREVTRKDTARVEDGPFAGFTGICQRTTRERVWLLLNLFGRPSEVPFNRNQVELV